jgi:alpha/beta superfamily hydrolase
MRRSNIMDFPRRCFSKSRVTKALWVTTLYLLGVVFAAEFSSSSSIAAGEPDNLEEPLCWGLVERTLFQAWANIANKNGRPNKAVEGIVFQDQTFTTPDQRRIYGYVAHKKTAVVDQLDAIVIVPGNAMLADQIYRFAAYFAAQNMAAYVFDYRGYGGSTGVPYANAMIADYRKIFSLISEKGHRTINIYALSFGGIVSLAVMRDSKPPAALVLDGVPSNLPWYAWCPNRLNPVETLKNAPARTLIISGTKDPVIPPSQSAELRRKALELGMTAEVAEGFSHPGLDHPVMETKRLKIVSAFFKSTVKQ